MYVPFIRTNKVAPDNIQNFTLETFDGGINNSKLPMLLNDDEAMDMLNYSLKDEAKRSGSVLYDEFDVEEPILYQDIYHPINKEKILIRATKTEVYANQDKLIDVSGVIKGFTYIGNYYFVDGNSYYQYDGEDVYEILSYPFAYLSDSVGSSDITVKVKDWDDRIKVGLKGQIESIDNIKTFEVATIDDVNLEFTITNSFGVEFEEGDFVRLYLPLDETHYRGTFEVDEINKRKWYQPCEHELDDIHKGEHHLPSNCSCLTIDKERIYIAGCADNPHEIYISDINNPFYFPVNLGLQCPPNGDKIVGLVNYDDGIIVGRSDDIFIIRGITSDLEISQGYALRQVSTSTGFVSRDVACIVNGYLFYVGSDLNVYGLTPTWGTEVLNTTVINKEKVDFTKPPFNLTRSDFKYSSAIFHEGEYYLLVKDLVLVYNYAKMAWTKYSGWNATSIVKDEEEVFVGTEQGITLKLADVYSDNGSAIECYYRTKQFYLGNPINFKNFLDMFTVTHVFDGIKSSIKILALVDYDEIDTTTEIINMISRFGITAFGDILIAGNIVQSDMIPINLRGRMISFVFSNNEVGERMKVYQLSSTYILRGVR